MTKARQLADLGNVYDDGALSNRNIIINGEFDIDQRGLASSTAFQAGAHFVADRWSYYINSEALEHLVQLMRYQMKHLQGLLNL